VYTGSIPVDASNLDDSAVPVPSPRGSVSILEALRAANFLIEAREIAEPYAAKSATA
jgi:hypothetical protein